MNNLLSNCGLVDVKIRASDKDLPVLISEWYIMQKINKCSTLLKILFSSLILHCMAEYMLHTTWFRGGYNSNSFDAPPSSQNV